MTFDFSKLTPAARERIEQSREWATERRIEFANMTDETLIATAQFYMAHMVAPRQFAPGEPVYDATMWHIILPELLRRLTHHG